MKHPTTFVSAALIADVKAATATCTAAMNEQFLALVANDPDIARFDAKIALAVAKRKSAMAALLKHVSTYGW
jgi:hypothetical protein